MTDKSRGVLWGRAIRVMVLCVLGASVAACSTTKKHEPRPVKRSKEYFSEKEYGVKASPRVHHGRNVPKGGGRQIVGKPYVVKGKVYVPKEDKNYDKTGLASWYGSAFHGRLTANGEVYDQYHLSAAHPTFPLPSYARVTNLKTGDSVIVRVNDRGPYHEGRIIDVSQKAAEMLSIHRDGTAPVRVQYVGPARMDGHDMPFLMASYTRKGERLRRFNPDGEIATGVMVASNDTKFTPKATYDSAGSTATALQSAKSTPSEAALAEFVAYVALPEFGPMPAERPHDYEPGMATLSAYADMRVKDASVPFDSVLTETSSGLSAEAVQQAAQRLKPGLF